jgi:signal recognition particle subunit SRP54
MVLEKLGESLRKTLSKLAGSLFIDEKLINELIKEIQRALLQSDVNVNQVFELSSKIKERALKEKPPQGISRKDYIVKIVYEEIARFMGDEESKIDLINKPTKILLVGLFGSGKTTQSGKLAHYFKKRGNKVAMIQTDVWRPAAYDQLSQLGKKIGVDVFGNHKEKDPVKIYKAFEKELAKYDVVIIDSAGRDALSDELIDELKSLNSVVMPHERILVISSDIGQTAISQAKAFHESCDVNGIIITKLDGTAKGGGALAACAVSGAKIKFIGTGEKIDDLERFNPKGFVGRLLGMGDLDSLLEKISTAFENEDIEDVSKKLLKGEFNLVDLYEQLESMKKLGPLSKVFEMIPGFSNANIPKDMIHVQQEKMEKWKIAMLSMTRKELEDPEIIDSARIERISEGSGISQSDIRELVKQYKQSKKILKMLKGSEKNMGKVLSKMGARMPKSN